jgi:DeoR/GlpR family transcriptional regulator of sugar metabolism
MKTNKHQTLLLVSQRKAVRARDVVLAARYSADTARSYLSHLRRLGLLERTGSGYVLTEKGSDRLRFFEVSGCGNFAAHFAKERQAT